MIKNKTSLLFASGKFLMCVNKLSMFALLGNVLLLIYD